MPCLAPLDAFRSQELNPNTRKFPIVFQLRKGHHDLPITIPCGQCRFCRLEHSRQWAIRASHEAKMYQSNSFITLTYSPEHLPKNGSLNYDHPVTFMKDLRNHLAYQGKPPIRSFGCAEYGSKGQRPHYHILIFNFDFPDKKLWKTINGNRLYTSQLLSQLWPYGFTSIGDVTFESAAYVARYVTKKLTGKRAHEYGDRLPERSICVSRMPGLGRPWLDKFGTDVYPSDEVILRGKKMKPPKYYDKIYDQGLDTAPIITKVKKERKRKGKEFAAKNPEESRGCRLMDKAIVQESKFKLLFRKYEND